MELHVLIVHLVKVELRAQIQAIQLLIVGLTLIAREAAVIKAPALALLPRPQQKHQLLVVSALGVKTKMLALLIISAVDLNMNSVEIAGLITNLLIGCMLSDG